MPTKRRNYKKQATDAWGTWVRSRGHCQSDRETHSGHLQAAHIITRGYGVTRTDPENGLAMCQGCHMFFTHRPIEWDDWIELRWPGLLDELKSKARTHAKVDWQGQADYWKAVVAGSETPTTRLI